MEKLRIVLSKLQERLDELENVLVEEIKQLSLPTVNPVALQCISDSKSCLLSAVNFYDLQRRDVEKKESMLAPYAEHPHLRSKWKLISKTTKRANELNQKSFHLLEMHMQRAEAFKKIVKNTGITDALYGSSGKSENTSGRSYNISI